MWSGDNHYSDTQFIQVSCSCPVCFFKDSVDNKCWEYRQLGDKTNSEAIILIPGIRETVSSYFQLMPALASRGYRVLTVAYQDQENFTQISNGFNELMRHLQIREIHFCGNEFGGFLSLQIASAPKKCFLTKSITLINSYTKQPNLTARSSFKLFNLMSAKSELIKDLETFHVFERLSESLLFVTHEIEQITTQIANSRVQLKNSRPFPIDVQIPDEAICVVETNDKLIQYSDECDPMKKFPKARLSLMKNGGDWPHLENPADLLSYLFVHLGKWGPQIVQSETETN